MLQIDPDARITPELALKNVFLREGRAIQSKKNMPFQCLDNELVSS